MSRPTDEQYNDILDANAKAKAEAKAKKSMVSHMKELPRRAAESIRRETEALGGGEDVVRVGGCA